jgi:hypothetical protein
MAIFEIQGADGKVYEVDAPDQNSAIAAFRKMTEAATPPRGPDGMTTAERIAAAKAGTLAQPSPDRLAAASAADEAALAGMQPSRGIGEMIYENVIGSGAVDTPGERVGELVRGLGAAIPRGAAGLLGLPGDIGLLMDTGAKKLGLIPQETPASPVFSAMSGDTMRKGLSAVTGGQTDYVAPGFLGKVAGTAGEFIGGGSGAKLGAAAGVGSEALGAATEGTAYEPYARLVGAMGGALAYQGVSGLVSAAKRNKSIRAFMDKTPDVDALKAQAGALYDDARASGTAATPAQVNTLGDDLMATLRGEGLITPKGNMAGSYPKVSDAIKLIDDYRGAPMTPTEMLQVRKSLQAAARSADPVEARIGTLLIRQFDDFTSPLAPQIAEANAIYRRAMQGDMIETTIELAGSKAGQFSGSGFENALRTEFRALERKIIKGQLKVTPDEEALIKQIAQGGFAENLARDIGKAAPRGVVSTAGAGGVPFAVGATLGTPALGLAMGGATLAAGEVGRRVATAMQTRNADLLSALARSGGKLPAELAGGGQSSIRRLIPGLLAQ